MERVQPVLVVTLLVAILGAVFAFVAMRVAFEARDAAWSAAHADGGDNWYEIDQLQTALIRAGVIEDPYLSPDDHGEVDGPWARCLTAAERDELPSDAGDGTLPPPCDVLPASYDEACPEPVPPSEQDDGEGVEEPCEIAWVVDGRRFVSWEQAYPEDVNAAAEEWFLAGGDDGADRVARGPDVTYLHVVGQGWQRLHDEY